MGLRARFAPLGEETRLQAMTDLLSFGRRNGEGINQVLTRCEIVRQRASTEGFVAMSTRMRTPTAPSMWSFHEPNDAIASTVQFQSPSKWAATQCSLCFDEKDGPYHCGHSRNIGAALHGSRGGGSPHLLAESFT